MNYSETNPSPEVAASRHARGGFYIAATASLIVAIISAINLVQLNMETNWTKTDASLLKTVIEGTGKEQALKVTYKYRIGSQSITATETQSGAAIRSLMTSDENAKLSDTEALQHAKNGFENRKNFSVYYNPSSPLESRIVNVDLSKLMTYFAALAGVCVCVLLGSVWILLKREPGMPSIKEHARAAEAKAAEHNQAIVDSLHERRTVVDPQVGSGSSESITLDNAATEGTSDGAKIDIKKTEKETL